MTNLFTIYDHQEELIDLINKKSWIRVAKSINNTLRVWVLGDNTDDFFIPAEHLDKLLTYKSIHHLYKYAKRFELPNTKERFNAHIDHLIALDKAHKAQTQSDDSSVCPQSVSCDTPTNESSSQDGGYPISIPEEFDEITFDEYRRFESLNHIVGIVTFKHEFLADYCYISIFSKALCKPLNSAIVRKDTIADVKTYSDLLTAIKDISVHYRILDLYCAYLESHKPTPDCPQSVSCDTPTNESGSQDGGYPFSACSHNSQGVGADFFTPASMGG